MGVGWIGPAMMPGCRACLPALEQQTSQQGQDRGLAESAKRGSREIEAEAQAASLGDRVGLVGPRESPCGSTVDLGAGRASTGAWRCSSGSPAQVW